MNNLCKSPVFTRDNKPALGAIIDYTYAADYLTRRSVYDNRGGDPRKGILFETLVDNHGEIGAVLVFFTKAVRSLERDKRYVTLPKGPDRTAIAHGCPDMNVQVDIAHLLYVPNFSVCVAESKHALGDGLRKKILQARNDLYLDAPLHDVRERMEVQGLGDEAHVLSRKGVSPKGWVARGYAHA